MAGKPPSHVRRSRAEHVTCDVTPNILSHLLICCKYKIKEVKKNDDSSAEA